MHELSVAEQLVELIEHQLRDAGRVKVTKVNLTIGPLSGIEPQALRFAYDSAVCGTMLEGSAVHITEIRPVVFCDTCNTEREIESVQRLRCPVCDTPTPTIVRGRELEIASVEVVDV